MINRSVRQTTTPSSKQKTHCLSFSLPFWGGDLTVNNFHKTGLRTSHALLFHHRFLIHVMVLFTSTRLLTSLLVVTTMSSLVNGCTLDIVIHTDRNPEQVSWTLLDSANNVVKQYDNTQGLPNYVVLSDSVPVIEGEEYTFEINDRDGLCCKNGQGSFEVKIGDNVLLSGGRFKKSMGVIFVPSECSVAPPPTTTTLATTTTQATSKFNVQAVW